MNKTFAVGLMSGTSLDGVDAALVSLEEVDDDIKVELLAFEKIEINPNLLHQIKSGINKDTSSNELLCSLNFELGYLFAEAVRAVCKKIRFPLAKLNFIASHGQTIYHIPKSSKLQSSTMQLGEPAVIAYETGVKVISNFRSMDIAAGGEGAPLVPFADYSLFKSDKETVVLLNIGGIANITVLPAGGGLSKVYAFDTGPGNMIIDELMNHYYNKSYDCNGEIGLRGTIITELYEELKKHPYIIEKPPKSTGREMFGVAFAHEIISHYSTYNSEDIVKTLTSYTTWSIIENINRYVECDLHVDRLIVSGGGVYNQCIMDGLTKGLAETKVQSLGNLNILPDAKEAIAFSVLGYRTLNNQFSNVKTATGAKSDVILGSITYV
jgi:anhydro-N-acetylmuramic acid kinase